MTRLIGFVAVALAGTALGLMLGQTDLGAGAAVAVVIFFILAIFVFSYFRFGPKEEGM